MGDPEEDVVMDEIMTPQLPSKKGGSESVSRRLDRVLKASGQNPAQFRLIARTITKPMNAVLTKMSEETETAITEEFHHQSRNVGIALALLSPFVSYSIETYVGELSPAEKDAMRTLDMLDMITEPRSPPRVATDSDEAMEDTNSEAHSEGSLLLEMIDNPHNISSLLHNWPVLSLPFLVRTSL